MQNQQNQWKSAIIPIITVGAFLGVVMFLFRWTRDTASPIVALASVGVLLLLAAVTYILLWRIPNEEKWQKLTLPLYSFLAFIVLPLIPFLLLAVSKAGYLKHLKLDNTSALFIIGIGICTIWGVALWQLRRKKMREHPPSDEEKSLEAEFQAALRRRATGWGMTPQEALREGWKFTLMGLLIGGGGLAIPILMFLYGGSTQSLKGIIYLIMSAFFLVGYLWFLFFLLRYGLRLLHAGRVWREQPGGTLTMKGRAIAFWVDARGGDRINGELLKLRLYDGTSKIFYLKEAMMDNLPEEEEPEIQIDYLFGCEAVVAVKALSTVSTYDDDERQESEEE